MFNFTSPPPPESGIAEVAQASAGSPSRSAAMIELVSAARALLRADDLHLDNRAEKAALRTALRCFETGEK